MDATAAQLDETRRTVVRLEAELAQERAERQGLEAELRRKLPLLRDVDRLETLARIAAVIAHDFRNLFSALAVAERRLRRPDVDHSALARALRASVSLGEFLISRLHQVTARHADVITTCDAALALRDLTPLLEILTRASARVEVAPCERPLWIAAPPGAFEQVVMNLALNAAAAMTDGTIRLGVRGDGAEVVFTIADNGRGIPAEQLENVFDLGYSTRHEGQGIGLATVRATVHEFAGSIHLRSTVGVGTEVIVRWPAAAPPASL